MEFTLVNGRFTAKESEELLAGLVKVKTDFHKRKLNTVNHSEEELKNSEQRLKDLEEHLRRITNMLQSGSYANMALRARLSVEFVPDYQNV